MLNKYDDSFQFTSTLTQNRLYILQIPYKLCVPTVTYIFALIFLKF